MRGALILILAVASILRLVGSQPGYNHFHSDEPVIYGGAVDMIRKNSLYPGTFYYGALPILINSIVYRTILIPPAWLNLLVRHIGDIYNGLIPLKTSEQVRHALQEYIFGVREVNVIFWTRYITGVFGIGIVFLTYLLGKRLFNKKVGILAAAFITFNYKHVVNSHLGLPDIYNSFFSFFSSGFLPNLEKT